ADEQKQKMIESGHAALINWAQSVGEGSDYTDNLPHQCLHPVGHWFEVPNLLLNGTLETLLRERPALRHLMLHNIDTLRADPDLADKEKVAAAVRDVAARMQTYITLKEVKKRWGHGQEDVFPVAQWEKLWSDMSSLAGVHSSFFVVPRKRGQQLKEQAQLDGW